jgi:hypothetical protein
MITPAKVIFAIMLGAIAGSVFFFEAVHDVFAVWNSPIVTGQIVAREPIRQFSVPRVDFAIRIDGVDAVIHARAQRNLMAKVPATVRFHYSGDPSREVFLFEHEENPCWIFLFCWGAAAVLTVSVKSAGVRDLLGWTKIDVHETAA